MFIRGINGSLINNDHVLEYVPDRSEDGTLKRWIARLTDGRSRALDQFYVEDPGRLERAVGFVPDDAHPNRAGKSATGR
ncbi:MAG: hypothetical protein AB7H90_01170 [Alphaproteobacteria bacterium]